MPVYETAGNCLEWQAFPNFVCYQRTLWENIGLAEIQPWDGTSEISEPSAENLVRQLRKERGMSQAAVAQCVGLSRQSLNAIENGKSQPRLLVAYSLARLFQRPIEHVFPLDGHEPGCS